MMINSNSPLPWSMSTTEKGWTEIVDAEGKTVCQVADWKEGEIQDFYKDVVTARRDAELILKCVNIVGGVVEEIRKENAERIKNSRLTIKADKEWEKRLREELEEEAN